MPFPHLFRPIVFASIGVGIALLVAPAISNASEPFCPAGEITLTSNDFSVKRSGANLDKVVSRKNGFFVPVGKAIDPGAEDLVFSLWSDGQEFYQATLPAGALVAKSSGKYFRFRQTSGGAPVGAGSALSLRERDDGFRMKLRFRGLDLTAADLPSAGERVKQIVKIGDDCFSSYLICPTAATTVKCEPERTATLKGKVKGVTGDALVGSMVTAYDDSRLESVSVFVQENGRYAMPPVRPGVYRLRARLIGYDDDTLASVVIKKGKSNRVDFTLVPAINTNDLLPAVYFKSLLNDKWPNETVNGDFALSCGNCHQIGDWRFRRARTEAEWDTVVTQMISYLPPYFQQTRDRLLDGMISTYGPNAPAYPTFDLPPPPSGDILGAVIYEYGLGDESSFPSCHDLELGFDNVVYADGGVRWIDPRTGERGIHTLVGGAHSIERGPTGNMWITQAGADALAKLDVSTGVITYFPLPEIMGVQGTYPHTLRFDAAGKIWFTTTKSNHITLFDPDTEQFTYYDLPEADAAEVGLSIPTAYGCDTAPDGTVWWSQLHGQRIGRFDPVTEVVRAWKPPFYGPRRLHVGADGIVWVPGYGTGTLGRFDPAIERWKSYDLPTGIPGPPGFGNSETPYALNVNRENGEVWIAGSNSDTLIRFDPSREEFTAFPLPTMSSYTREVEFDADNNIWTCTSSQPPAEGEIGRGKFIKIELPPVTALCGDGVVGGKEDCDDGNTDDCDSCTNACRSAAGCGDGALCNDEVCDDGNSDNCDGCTALCEIETGLLCGDSELNTVCGEECDPPLEDFCTDQCTVPIACGNGQIDGVEECDDGNNDDCDTCSNACVLITGCGDGAVCGVEQCDDGNASECDGCLPGCIFETGHICGDGIVKGACGEVCDPPQLAAPECSYICQPGPAAALGTRHMSFGGSAYSSALGTGSPLGTLEGDFDLVAGAPTPDGLTTVTLTGPVIYKAAILGGSFGYMCFNISSCTGIIDCNGGTAVGVEVERDSAGPGFAGLPPTITTGLGGDGGPGSVLLTCSQAFRQIPPGGGDDCAALFFPPEETIIYTTGLTDGYFINAYVEIGTGAISLSGENFVCADWTTEDGPGTLVATFLIENDSQAGDTANISEVDD
jgi:cysteine-rich repeat protein